jgi:hypothetical protein
VENLKEKIKITNNKFQIKFITKIPNLKFKFAFLTQIQNLKKVDVGDLKFGI